VDEHLGRKRQGCAAHGTADNSFCYRDRIVYPCFSHINNLLMEHIEAVTRSSQFYFPIVSPTGIPALDSMARIGSCKAWIRIR
jgi:hypothetical protein